MYRDLIYKDDLVRSMRSRLPQDEFQWFANVINEQPLVNAQPIVYGEWIEDYNNTYGRCRMKCSVCGKFSGIGGVKSNQRKPFCPNCGARMKTAENERDYERIIEQIQHDMLYELTYNPEDGSM